MKTTSLFEKFLINRGLLEKFKHNLKVCTWARFHTIDDLIRETSTKHLVLKSFDWETTPERYYFWAEVDSEWEQCIKKGTL